jgi:hypothetical protein
MNMSQLGFSVMINMLAGNRESVAAVQAALGKTITSVALVDDALKFDFEDGSRLTLKDDGQSCCESRYMRTDDDLPYYVGARFLGAEVRDGGTTESEYGDTHEIEFLVITTDRGTFSMANHNQHNGYYGGFSITASAD